MSGEEYVNWQGYLMYRWEAEGKLPTKVIGK